MLGMVATLEPGKVARLKLRRAGQDITADVTIGKRPKPPKE
jgi:hypothetical protein